MTSDELNELRARAILSKVLLYKGEAHDVAQAIAAAEAAAGLVTVPREPTEAMWSGLARDMMLWLSFEHPTPSVLFKHLQSSGVPIPQWLRDEPEMKRLDHVPSKGTRCVLIYKAMLPPPTTTEETT